MTCFNIPGDLAISDDGKRLLWWQGAEEVAQRVNVKLQVPRGIWHYDTRTGIRYFDGIFEKPASAGIALLRAEVWRTIAETAGIRAVYSVEISYDPTTRSATCAWRALTDSGTTEGYVTWT